MRRCASAWQWLDSRAVLSHCAQLARSVEHGALWQWLHVYVHWCQLLCHVHDDAVR